MNRLELFADGKRRSGAADESDQNEESDRVRHQLDELHGESPTEDRKALKLNQQRIRKSEKETRQERGQRPPLAEDHRG